MREIGDFTFRIAYGDQAEGGLGLGEIAFAAPDAEFEPLADGRLGNGYAEDEEVLPVHLTTVVEVDDSEIIM